MKTEKASERELGTFCGVEHTTTGVRKLEGGSILPSFTGGHVRDAISAGLFTLSEA